MCDLCNYYIFVPCQVLFTLRPIFCSIADTMVTQLPPEVIGRIIHYCQSRHSLLSPNHQAKRRDIHQRLSQVGQVWNVYATEEANQYRVVRQSSKEGKVPVLTLSEGGWQKWSAYDVQVECELRLGYIFRCLYYKKILWKVNGAIQNIEQIA